MKSIGTRLLFMILPALAVVWLICSSALYLSTQKALYASVDKELALLAVDTPLLLSRPNERFRKRFQTKARIYEEGAAYYFQIWDPKGNTRKRSPSLRDQDLPFLGPFQRQKSYHLRQLPDGTHLRTIEYRIMQKKKPPPGRGPRGMNLVVAKDLTEVRETLKDLRHSIFLSTLCGLTIAGLIVVWSIKKGLSPLGNLSNQISTISSKNLDYRLDPSDSPTELQLVSQKVNNLLERLEEAFERERRFGSDLAHEIRTPTAEIKALAEVGLTWPEEFGNAELRNIFQSAQRMESTTEAILALTRLSSAAELEDEEIDLRPLIEGHIPQDREINVEGATQVLTNRSYLDIILKNLIGNAVAYAPENDDLNITIAETSVEITNTAPDLEEQDLTRLFERFWRKDESRTSGSHAGLGLRLASTCADRLQLTITPLLRNQRLTMKLEGFQHVSPPQEQSSSLR